MASVAKCAQRGDVFVDAVAVFQSAVDDVIAFFARQPECVREYLTRSQLSQVQANPAWGPAIYGIAVEHAVRDVIYVSEYCNMFSYCGPRGGVDFEIAPDSPFTGAIEGVDITTVADYQAHIDRYASQEIVIDCAVYERPGNYMEAFSK